MNFGLNPFLAMTLIDLLVIAVSVALAIHFLRQRPPAMQMAGRGGLILIVGGLSLLAAFHAADLIAMQLLPSWIGQERAFRIVFWLQLNLRWFATIVPLGLLVAGIILNGRDNGRAAAALRESEARFRDFVENTSDWVWEINREGLGTYSNGQVERLLGYTPDQLRGKDWRMLVHPDDHADGEARIRRAIERREGWHNWIVKALHRDGSVRYLESNAEPVIDADGSVSGFRGTERDATFTTLMLKISSDLVASPASEVDERIEQALSMIAAAYGIQRASFWIQDGKYTRRCCHWAQSGMEGPLRVMATARAPGMARMISSGRTVRIESLDDPVLGDDDREALRKNRVMSTLIIPVQGESGAIATCVFSTVDHERKWPDKIVTEIRLLAEKIVAVHAHWQAARAALRRERDLEQSETLAKIGSFSCYPEHDDAVFPDEWKIVISKQQQLTLEFDTATPTFDMFLERVHEEDREKVTAVIRKLVIEGGEFEIDYRLVNPGGDVRYISNRTRMDRDEAGRNLRIIGADRDVTDHVHREDSLKRALAEIGQLRDRLEKENIQLREEVRSIKEFDQIVGESEALKRPLDLVSKAAPTNASILILGETGTGKELVARAIHNLSARRDGPMISLNCTALPAELVESELFGHEKGAFTGAHKRRPGRFELADGGTIFLDEIGDLPLGLQAKLLRVLQEGALEPLGSTSTIRVDVRLIAATNRDLEAAVARGEFRSDLYYRINTVPIRMPPLRDRKEDISLLVHHFVRKHGPRIGRRVDAVATELVRALQRRQWPGNVRELENLVERLLIASTGTTLTLADWKLSEDFGSSFNGRSNGHANGNGHGANGHGESSDLKSVERDHILGVLDETGWIIGGDHGAAARLGLPPSTLRSKMKKLAISRQND